MKLKLDENLPESLLRELGSMGHDMDNVHLEGLAGRNDPDVWQAAPRVCHRGQTGRIPETG